MNREHGLLGRRLTAFDWPLATLSVILSIIGILTIYSANRPLEPGAAGGGTLLYMKQLYWLLAGLLAMFGAARVDYIFIERISTPLYLLSTGALAATLWYSPEVAGVHRWLRIGPISVQTSEFARLAFLVALSSGLSKSSSKLGVAEALKNFLLYAFLPFVLIVRQPDLGGSLIILMLFAAVALYAGLERRALLSMIVLAALAAPFLGGLIWQGLEDYQKSRVTAFISPQADSGGAGYHTRQSKVAVGSGGFSGKGYLKGTQGPFRFLPERHTDFIFSVYAEERGFTGSLFLLLLYLLLTLRGLDTARLAKDPFGRTLAFGLTVMIALNAVLNLSMTVGLAPVTGVPLPFMSYGGSAIVTNFIAIGLLISIRSRRFELFY